MNTEIRNVLESDIPELKLVLNSSELFPSYLLDDMISEYLYKESSKDIWFTTIQNGHLISIGYCAPEKLTEGTYNLYAIAVSKDHQGKGIGRQMMNYIESKLRNNGHRILIVETSGKPQFKRTREFYIKCNYVQQAVIPEFYDEGDDKIVFWKKLQS